MTAKPYTVLAACISARSTDDRANYYYRGAVLPELRAGEVERLLDMDLIAQVATPPEPGTGVDPADASLGSEYHIGVDESKLPEDGPLKSPRATARRG